MEVSYKIEQFYRWFASIGISRIWMQRDSHGKLTKRYVKSWRLLAFIILRINLYSKMLFLLYLLTPGQSDSLDFLTKLGIVIWLGSGSAAIYSDYYFARIFPAFELFGAFWQVQREIQQNLPKLERNQFALELNHSAKLLTTVHTVASLYALIGVVIQYLLDPSGIIYTGSLIGSDSPLVIYFFAVHEALFILCVWYQAVSNILIPVLLSKELTICLKFLEIQILHLEKPPSKKASPSGTFTSIPAIFSVYRHLEIISDRLKDLSAFLLLITHLIYLAVVTTDVFVAIQLTEAGDSFGAAYFAADCSAWMIYWFFSLYSMGRLHISMESFRSSLNYYFRLLHGSNLKNNLRIWSSFRTVGVYLGPNLIKRGTAPEIIFELFNYYILAALWKPQ